MKDGVIRQSVQDLGDARGISLQCFRNERIHADHEFQVPFFRLGCVGGTQSLHQGRQAEGVFLQFKGVPRQGRKIQQLIDHVEQRLHSLLKLVDIAALLFGHGCLGKKIAHAHDGVEGSAHFMVQTSQKFALERFRQNGRTVIGSRRGRGSPFRDAVPRRSGHIRAGW